MYKNIMIPVAPDHPERLAEQLSVAKALADSGYQGFVSGEFMPLPDADTAAQRGIAHLRQL